MESRTAQWVLILGASSGFGAAMTAVDGGEDIVA